MRKETRKRKYKEGQILGSTTGQDLMEKVMKLKMLRAHAPLTSTPAGQYTEVRSMKPFSSRIGPSGGGDDDDP